MVQLFIIIGGVIGAAILAGAGIVFKKKPRKINQNRFQGKWRDMQKTLPDKKAWSSAIIDADKMLDKALKKKRFSGKTMGERLTKAQRKLTDNEAVWFGHKLRGKLEADPGMKPKEADVRDALIGIRQALKDLGALPNGRQSDKK